MRKSIYTICFIIVCNTINAQTGADVKIPIDTARWYQMNYTTGNLAKLFDGDKNTVAFTGWSKILSNYEAYYPLLDGETMTIDSIRMYDKEGVFTTAPLTIYAITDTWQRKLIATFTGESYNVWGGPYPSRPNVFKLDTAVTNIRYLLLNINYNNFPGEIELYGTYTPGNAPASNASPARTSLGNMFGINGFAWDFMQSLNARAINETKMQAIKSFRGFRQYIDWANLEEVQGRYTFSPLARGGWTLDTIYKRCQQEGIDVLPCLQNIPPWMVATYPSDQQAGDNNPVQYGKSFSDPASYIELAKLGFQFAARYGNNTNVDTSQVSVYGVPQWYNQTVNQKKIGLGLIKYIECGNEQDKWWKGRKGYLTGREYAAELSAFYDGNKNTMGPAAGIKNADSSMKVVMTGTAFASTDYFRGIIDWCKEFRGYNADGTVNLCFDIINYHLYSNNANSSQSGNSTRGAAPEVSNCSAVANSFIQAAHFYANDRPVWITEEGYDTSQGSPLKAIPVGNRSVLQTQADWVLRSALLYARAGLQKGFFYEVYDNNPAYNGMFSTSGLINKTDTTRRPAADFLYQTNKLFGAYTYQQTTNSDPIVDQYALNGQSMYVLVVPDEKGRTANYTLNLGAVDSAIIYMPAEGKNDMTANSVKTSNGQLQLTVTETPVFVVPSKFYDTTAYVIDTALQNLSTGLSRQRYQNTPALSENSKQPAPVGFDHTPQKALLLTSSHHYPWLIDSIAIINAMDRQSALLTSPLYTRQANENKYRNLANNAPVSRNKSEAILNSEVLLYPNPTTDLLFIENKKKRKLKLVLINMQGNKIMETTLFARNGTIHVNGLAQGAYLLSISDMDTHGTVGKLFIKY